MCQEEVGDRKFIGLEFVQVTTDKVNVIKKRMKATQDMKKSYEDNRRKPLEFEVEDQMFLKVILQKNIMDSE